MNSLLKLGEAPSKRQQLILGTLGFFAILALWQAIVTFSGIPTSIFPSPLKVISAFQELYRDYNLIGNLWFSTKLNFTGYAEAIAISIPLGFIVGMFGTANGLFSKWVDSTRFIPLTAVTGIFIGIFGIGYGMKVHFLAFGIIIYLLPIFVTRVSEVPYVYKQTMWTIGANKWTTFKRVYFPCVMSKIFSDIRVIVAISWTYIIVAELIAKDFGVGAMIATAEKQSRTDMVFAILISIMAAGYLSDLIFYALDRIFFPYKYTTHQVGIIQSVVIRVKTLYAKVKPTVDKFVVKPKKEEA